MGWGGVGGRNNKLVCQPDTLHKLTIKIKERQHLGWLTNSFTFTTSTPALRSSPAETKHKEKTWGMFARERSPEETGGVRSQRARRNTFQAHKSVWMSEKHK